MKQGDKVIVCYSYDDTIDVCINRPVETIQSINKDNEAWLEDDGEVNVCNLAPIKEVLALLLETRKKLNKRIKLLERLIKDDTK